MKEELQSKLVEILTSMQNVAGKAGDFAMEQLPDVAQSYVLYGRAWYTCAAIIWLAATLALAAFVWRSRKKSDPFFEYLVGGLLSVCAGLFTLMALKSAMLVWMAPKVWLLKEIAGLVK